MPHTSARVRHVYLGIGEVIDPKTSPIDVTRSDDWTLYTVHPEILDGAPRSATEIAAQISPWLDTDDAIELITHPRTLLGTPPPRPQQES